MKGVHFLMNEQNEKIAVQIDLKVIEKNQEALEDFLDVILATARKDDEDIDWISAKQQLKKEGKL